MPTQRLHQVVTAQATSFGDVELSFPPVPQSLAWTGTISAVALTGDVSTATWTAYINSNPAGSWYGILPWGPIQAISQEVITVKGSGLSDGAEVQMVWLGRSDPVSQAQPVSPGSMGSTPKITDTTATIEGNVDVTGIINAQITNSTLDVNVQGTTDINVTNSTLTVEPQSGALFDMSGSKIDVNAGTIDVQNVSGGALSTQQEQILLASGNCTYAVNSYATLAIPDIPPAVQSLVIIPPASNTPSPTGAYVSYIIDNVVYITRIYNAGQSPIVIPAFAIPNAQSGSSVQFAGSTTGCAGDAYVIGLLYPGSMDLNVQNSGEAINSLTEAPPGLIIATNSGLTATTQLLKSANPVTLYRLTVTGYSTAELWAQVSCPGNRGSQIVNGILGDLYAYAGSAVLDMEYPGGFTLPHDSVDGYTYLESTLKAGSGTFSVTYQYVN